jgi:hypothetical protein
MAKSRFMEGLGDLPKNPAEREAASPSLIEAILERFGLPKTNCLWAAITLHNRNSTSSNPYITLGFASAPDIGLWEEPISTTQR